MATEERQTSLADELRGKRVLVTGGLGMIGSTIAIKLVECGADVTVVDACIEPYGANLFNLEPVRASVRVNINDIRDREAMKCLVRDQDIVFNLAGQVSHNDSMDDPHLDADINYIGHLSVLECVRRCNPDAVVLHAGSRLQYGRIQSTPVSEDHPLRPRTPYALNKTAAESLYRFFYEIHGVRTVMLRIANPYGPRSQMKHSKYSMVNWFVRQAMEGETITVFGDGRQIRDYILVDDVAEAFIRGSVTPSCFGEVFNVGSGEGTPFVEMAGAVVETVGRGRIEHVPWPADYVNVETGDYVADTGKLNRATGWQAAVGLRDGIARTVEYYRQHRNEYW